MADQLFAQRHYDRADISVGGRILLTEFSGDGAHLLLGLLDRETRAQAPDDAKQTSAAILRIAGPLDARRPQLVARWILKLRWHDADYRVGLIIENKLTS